MPARIAGRKKKTNSERFLVFTGEGDLRIQIQLKSANAFRSSVATKMFANQD